MDGKTAPLDEEVIKRFQEGDETAFDVLLGRYDAPLRYFLRGKGLSHEDAEDAVQATWLATYQNLGKLRKPEAFRSWLYSIARKRAVDILRKRKIEFVPVEMHEIEDHQLLDIRVEISRRDEVALLQKAMEQVSPVHREVLILQFIEEMSYEEIAEICACNLGTVRSRIYYAKRSLLEQMEKLRDAD